MREEDSVIVPGFALRSSSGWRNEQYASFAPSFASAWREEKKSLGGRATRHAGLGREGTFLGIFEFLKAYELGFRV